METRTVKELGKENYDLVTEENHVKSFKEEKDICEEDYFSFLVKEKNGECVEIWGVETSFPYEDCEAHRLK